MQILKKLSLSNPFTIDLRSLALSRIILGFFLFLNFYISADDLTLFYTDYGLMPREALPIKFHGIRNLSINVLSGSYWFQFLVLAAAFLASILFILGAFSRISTFCSWILFLSFYNRNPLIVDGGDDALKLFLFWLCFLPVASFFSVDKKSAQKSNTILCSASAAFIIQLGSVYFFSALLKSSPQWRESGTALHYALALGIFTSKFGDYLLNFPEFLKIMTTITWHNELIVPLFLLVPIFTNFFRSVAIIVFVGFHIGLIIFMDLGLFPWIMISAWIALIPSYLWDLKIFSKLQEFIENFFSLLSKKIKTGVDAEPFFRTNDSTNLLCFALTIYITLWNIRGTDYARFEPYFSHRLNFIGNSIRLDQYWALFAPRPSQDGGWPVLSGHLVDKTIVSLPNGGPIDFRRPKTTASFYKNFRWKKYYLNTWLKDNSQFRKYYANYLCKSWNSTHSGDKKLKDLQIIFMLENTLPPERQARRSYPQPNIIWEQGC